MADPTDIAGELIDFEEQVRDANRKPYHIKPGAEGECENCGYNSKRLVNGLCSPCRNELRLP